MPWHAQRNHLGILPGTKPIHAGKNSRVGKDLAPYRIGKHSSPQNRAKIHQKYKKYDFQYFWYIFALFCLWGRFPILWGAKFFAILGEVIFARIHAGSVFSLARIQENIFEEVFPEYFAKFLGEFARCEYMPRLYLHPRICQENIPGKLFMYWFHARGHPRCPDLGDRDHL